MLRKIFFLCCVMIISTIVGSIVEANDACNCVEWVRNNKVATLPHGLCTLNDKKALPLSHVPKVGSVAIIDPPFILKSDEQCGNRQLKKGTSIGHVAYVEKVEGSQISIIEANFQPCKVGRRKGTENELRIVGYWNPTGSGGNPPSPSPSKDKYYIRITNIDDEGACYINGQKVASVR